MARPPADEYAPAETGKRGLFAVGNIGTSTSWQGDPANRWHHPYRHWLFTPSEFEFRPEMTKKSGPTQPT